MESCFPVTFASNCYFFSLDAYSLVRNNEISDQIGTRTIRYWIWNIVFALSSKYKEDGKVGKISGRVRNRQQKNSTVKLQNPLMLYNFLASNGTDLAILMRLYYKHTERRQQLEEQKMSRLL